MIKKPRSCPVEYLAYFSLVLIQLIIVAALWLN